MVSWLPVDQIPNLNIFMLLAATHLGIPYGQYVSDYQKLVAGVLCLGCDFERMTDLPLTKLIVVTQTENAVWTFRRNDWLWSTRRTTTRCRKCTLKSYE